MSKGLIKIKSSNNFETTYSKLKNVLEANPAIGIVAELDHQKNAERVGLTLSKTRMIMFGNPLLGTPLMQSDINISIDLPQKFVVFEGNDESVYITFNDPLYLKVRHAIKDEDKIFDKISEALHKIAIAASS